MVARFVEQGIDRSGLAGKQPSRGNMGSLWYDETNRRMLVYDETRRFWLPVDGQGYFDGLRYLADDFRGAALLSDYTVNKGSDDEAANPTLVDGSGIGLLRCTSGDAGSGTAADASSWTAGLHWEPEEGRITGHFRSLLSAITNVAAFIGFSDALASTLEMPFTLSGTTFTSTATDAAGFLFDTAATTDTIRCVGVKNNSDATPIDTGLAPVAATFNDFRIEIDEDGNATFWIDGEEIGTIENACSPGVALTPILVVVARSTASRNLDTDLVLVS